MSNSAAVQKAIKETLDELTAMTPEEFARLLSEHTKDMPKEFPEMDTVAMLRES